MKILPVISLIFAGSALAQGELAISNQGKPCCFIVQQAGATAAEQSAVTELALHLNLITGANFEIQTNITDAPKSAIIIGQGPLAAKLFPKINFASFGPEEFVIRSQGQRLLLAGGRPRGTLYAVNRFLQEQCGVRWWTPWATNLPPSRHVARAGSRHARSAGLRVSRAVLVRRF
jgi:hypothetical protein